MNNHAVWRVMIVDASNRLGT